MQRLQPKRTTRNRRQRKSVRQKLDSVAEVEMDFNRVESRVYRVSK
jgi:hypothetical protein